MKFTTETARAAHAIWLEKYSPEQRNWWASLGYFGLCTKYGHKVANKIAFGKHLSKGEAKKARATREATQDHSADIDF